MLIAGLTLGLGLLAVFLAILYRIFTYQSAGAPVPVVEGAAIPTVTRTALGLPADARLVSTSLDADRIALTYEHGAGSTIIVVDPAQLHRRSPPRLRAGRRVTVRNPGRFADCWGEAGDGVRPEGSSMAGRADKIGNSSQFPINGVLRHAVHRDPHGRHRADPQAVLPADPVGDRARHRRGAAP